MDHDIVDADGRKQYKGRDGQYHQEEGVFGPKRATTILGNPKVDRDLLNNPRAERDILGNQRTSASGQPLYQSSGSGGDFDNPLVLPWLILAALAVIFLPFYCAFRIADPSTRVPKIILHLYGIVISLSLLSHLLGSMIDESARDSYVEVVGWVTILLLLVPFVVRFLRSRSAH